MASVDLAFRVTGARIPVDHGYALYAAISRILPGIHAAREIGIHPIRGRYIGGDALQLSRSSCLTFRLPPDRIPDVLKLAGKILDVDGYRLGIGVPEARPLRPISVLYARLVTIKGFMESEGFLDAARRQLGLLGVDAALQVGNRRTLRVKDKQVVGFGLTVDGLDPQASLHLQTAGLGGRRRMGWPPPRPWQAPSPREPTQLGPGRDGAERSCRPRASGRLFQPEDVRPMRVAWVLETAMVGHP